MIAVYVQARNCCGGDPGVGHRYFKDRVRHDGNSRQRNTLH